MFSASLLKRFGRKVRVITDAKGKPDRTQCWLWVGAKTRGKAIYGHIRIGEGSRGHYKAHRVALAIRTKMMPGDMDAAHGETCTSKLCCNSWHLSWQTPVENRLNDTRRRHGRLYFRKRRQIEGSECESSPREGA